MRPEEERLLWQFLDWCRTQGYAVCEFDRGDKHHHGHWRPLAESAGTLLERFGAWRTQQDRRPTQGDDEGRAP